MKSGDIVARARVLIGVRFRPQGRSVEHGVDCVGAAAMATGMYGVRTDYCLRSSDADAVNGEFDRCGFNRMAPDEADEGDVLLVRPGPGQLHVVILTPDGYIHADMRLRRVVEVPGAVPWPILSTWRHPEHEDAGRLASRGAGRV